MEEFEQLFRSILFEIPLTHHNYMIYSQLWKGKRQRRVGFLVCCDKRHQGFFQEFSGICADMVCG
ncbi:MAG: hypothetical protein CSB23_04405 [Deltaproteobacteria bacterium]|nr:MAG: hypothetical protein CSB23_04405 [Deltaproteobacteria bacterium]